MKPRYYILDGHTPVGVDDVLEWAVWFEKEKRRVALTKTMNGATVSTVFLGLDYRFGDDGPPLLFQTLVFGGPNDESMERYSTWGEAEAGHEGFVERNGGKNDLTLNRRKEKSK